MQQLGRCHAETLGSSERSDRTQRENEIQGLSGLEVAAMKHLVSRSAESQMKQEGLQQLIG